MEELKATLPEHANLARDAEAAAAIRCSSRPWVSALGKAPWSAKLGLTIVLVYVAIAIFAPVIAPYGEGQIVGSEFDPWSANIRSAPITLDETC